MRFWFVLIIIFVSFFAFADNSSAVASRAENGETIFYTDLLEAFSAASGISIEAPDEIVLLADCVINSPIVIEDEKHIRLVSGNGERIIHRGKNNLEYPLIWLRGHHASFSLGKADMKDSIIVDGGNLDEEPIEALAPLVAVNGQYSKFIMYDNVFLQNNNSLSPTDGTDFYRNGAGVFIRTIDGTVENQVEFIMKGGTIRGNINNNQNPIPCGGGVLMSGIGTFTMEGGVIMNNTAYTTGGGVHAGSRSSFIKTGGIIYGEDAAPGYRNIAIDGFANPKVYGQAVCIALPEAPLFQYRNDTVGEDDSLSYIGSPTAVNGVFGKDDKWNNYPAEMQKRIMIIIIASVLLAAFAVFFITVKSRQRKIELRKTRIVSGVKLSPREKEVFDLLLTDMPIKQIAYTLKLSYSGVNFHIKNLYHKLSIQSRTELLIKFPKND
jgi:DNA-binding CsgD family transcriptional regulator